MKKIIKISLFISISFFLFACEKKSEPISDFPKETQVDKNAIEEGAHLILVDNEGEDGEWAQYVSERFTERYGIPVEVKNHAEINVLKEASDVFSFTNNLLSVYEKNGLLLENYLSQDEKNEFTHSSIKSLSLKEKTYGYPLSIETPIIFYNKALVEKEPETLEELLEDARAFTSKKERKFGLMFDPDNFYYTYPFFSIHKETLFDEHPEKTFAFLKDLKKDILPLTNEEISNENILKLFIEGNVQYAILGSFELQTVKNSNLDFSIMNFPNFDKVPPQTISTTKGYFIHKQSSFPNAANLFAKFATSDEMLLKRYEITGEIPPKKTIEFTDEFSPIVLKQSEHSNTELQDHKEVYFWNEANKNLAKNWNKND